MKLKRGVENYIEKLLTIFPAVVILGSRQCGKSTLVKMMLESTDGFLYLDLQDRRDIAKLSDVNLFFESNRDKTICLDEVQLMPELFSDLRSEIDRYRSPGRFILLGSASRKLVQSTTESLAGRVGLVDLTPFSIDEVCQTEGFSLNRFWFRGGYPDSYLAADDEFSSIWRENYLRTYIERDIPQLGFNIPSPKIMRLLSMLAYEHSGILNSAKLASSMDMSSTTIRHYIDLLEETYIVRVLEPYYKNIRKRLVKSPRVYIRDTGLLHQILNISSFNQLLGHPVLGHSWEGLVIENAITNTKGAKPSFYRSSDGKEEMDLLLEYTDRLIAIECKTSTSPQVTDGFWKALDTLQPNQTFVVAPVAESYPIHEKVTVTNLSGLIETIRDFS